MTTGYKINHARDNAANYSIAINMTTKIRAYQIAEDNCAMGLNLLNVANDNLNLISNKLGRLRALAEQAANGAYDKQSLNAINSEANAIIDEIERTYNTTEYNGIKMFGETQSGFITQVQKRDTSSMTTLESVAENTNISSGTYSISTAEELAKLATMVNAGNVSGGEFVLTNDIDLSQFSTGEGWTPIGDFNNAFSGIFDGNGYVISNLYINADASANGLFGVSIGSEIKNIGIENVKVTGKNYTGGLIGLSAASTISNCFVTGELTGINSSSINDSFVGVLVGTSGGSTVISNCYATCKVTGDNISGGLAGSLLDSSIISCYVTGNVKGDKDTGGIVGELNKSSLSHCYSTGVVTGNSHVGGLVGYNNAGSTTDSYYNSETSGQTDTGKGVGITSAELQALIANGTLCKAQQSDSEQILTLQIGINSSASSQLSLSIGFSINVSSLRNIGLDNSNYLSQIDNLIQAVSAKQTEFGTTQNRLESALEEISTHWENLNSSLSTLKDADIAQVSSQYIKQQILQQAGTTLLSTANQTSALALQLIGQM